MKSGILMLLLFIGMIAACKKEGNNGTTHNPKNNNWNNNANNNNGLNIRFDVASNFTFKCVKDGKQWEALRVKVRVEDGNYLRLKGVLDINHD